MKPLTKHTCLREIAGMYSILQPFSTRASIAGVRRGLQVLLISAVVGLSFPDASQAEGPIDNTSNTINDTTDDHETYGFRSGSFLVAPIPFKNPTIGAGLALGAGYLFKFDEASKTSHVALGAMLSDNGTNGIGAATSLAWNNNRWILDATVAEAEAFYDLYVGGVPVALRQEGSLFKASLLYGVTPHFFFGPEVRYLDTTVGLDGPGFLPPGLVPDSKLTLGNFGLVTRYDTRDDSLYPRLGVYLDSAILGGWTIEGIAKEYARGFINFALYRSIGDRTVFASQLSTCAASSDTPFFDQCALGKEDSFRGFSTTQYYDDRSLSLQLEIRRKLGTRLGLVAFAGAGMTGPDYASLDLGGVHAAGGLGVRFQLTKKFETDFSIDVSYNDEDEEIVYIYVGQRF
ncbi:BamA/TamA family outer membrane protein [Shimia gijangensis]|uniref:hypothetical protein n=1 Tax=Shimia gijangensis TaxID=1470563 RepID=UPI001114F06F|nr:hypothetical protein [Shimia gijangensis]